MASEKQIFQIDALRSTQSQVTKTGNINKDRACMISPKPIIVNGKDSIAYLPRIKAAGHIYQSEEDAKQHPFKIDSRILLLEICSSCSQEKMKKCSMTTQETIFFTAKS